MKQVVIVPKRHETFSRCLEALIRAPGRQMFQSSMKRVVYTKSWRLVVKREFELWNDLIFETFAGVQFVSFIPARNPHTGRRNEVLIRINPTIEVIDKSNHFLLLIDGGNDNDNESDKEKGDR